MKRINANFASKDYTYNFNMSATISRKIRSTIGIITGNAAGPTTLYPMETTHDEIKVEVYEPGSRIKPIATCLAHVSEVAASSVAFSENTVYMDAHQIGAEYASSRLEALRTSFGCYDPSHIRVLTISSIEVNPMYRRKGIATAIIDYIKTIVSPFCMVCPILPYYKPNVSPYMASLAETDKFAIEMLLRAMHFESIGTVHMNGAGTQLDVQVLKLDCGKN